MSFSAIGVSKAETVRYILNLEFENEWLMKHRDDDELPIAYFIRRMSAQIWEPKILGQSLTSCRLDFQVMEFHHSEDISSNIQSEAYKILGEEMDAISDVAVKRFSLNRRLPCDELPEKRKGKQDNGWRASLPDTPPAALSIMEKVHELVGADEFKSLAKEFCEVAPLVLRHDTQPVFLSQKYLFSIGSGCGLTTMSELMASLLTELQLVDCRRGVAKEIIVTEYEIAPGPVGLSETMGRISVGVENEKVICVDLREQMGNLRSIDFKAFLEKVTEDTEETVVIWHIPFVDPRIRYEVLTLLRDTMNVREIVIPSYTTEQLKVYANELLLKYHFKLDETGWRVFEEKLAEEKSNGRFYGLKTIKKAVNEIIYQKMLFQAQTPKEESLITGKEMQPILRTRATAPGSAAVRLESLIGMETIKSRLQEVVAQIKLAALEQGAEHPCYHMRFVGNPGTGKTVVARILGELLLEHGVLSSGKFFEFTGRDLCGKYIGETAPKTTGICQDAYGSVLFIDEAYSLYRGEDNDRDYGREALDTLIGEMENNREKLLVIMAGYPDEMAELMKGNPGLSSRMPYVIEFPNYSKEDLYKIFVSMAKENFKCTKGFLDTAKSYFDSLPDRVLTAREFSNARFVRNLFERTWAKAAIRKQMNPGKAFSLTAVDFEKAANDREFSQLLEGKKNRIGF